MNIDNLKKMFNLEHSFSLLTLCTFELNKAFNATMFDHMLLNTLKEQNNGIFIYEL
jgi:hypothetical protein